MNPGNFFAELKRRNVYKVAVAYAVVGWLLIQVTTQVFPFFAIPNWAIRLTILLLIVGFPVALVLAWAFEITPEGIKRADDVLPNESITKKTGRKLVAFTVVLVLIAGGWFVFQMFRPSLTGDLAEELGPKISRLIPEKSVAVMPFVNASGDANDEYFSDGLSEELIAVLGKIPGLKVIGRNSSFLFKGKPGDSASIGQKLGVAQLLEGSVRRQGDHVRIVAELIVASNGEQLWSETYNREVKDILAVQFEIAQIVAAQLKIKLLGDKPISDSARSNPNPAAHDALLQSRFYWNQGNNDGFRKAINYAEEATRLDPKYAEAWARLSIALRAYGVSGAVTAAGDETEQVLASARVAADKAYALDPESIDALMAMQGVAMYPDLDFAAAEKYGRRARELGPGNMTALLSLSSALIAQGKLEEAEPLLREVTAAEPLQFVNSHLLGLVLIGRHRYQEARDVFNQLLELHPKAARANVQLAILDVLGNNPKGALEHAHLEPEGGQHDFAIAMALQAGSDASATDAALQGFIDKSGQSMPCWVAMLYAQRHDPDQMFQWLETAFTNRDVALSRLFIFPFFLDYRGDPRFAAYCRKLRIEISPPKL